MDLKKINYKNLIVIQIKDKVELLGYIEHPHPYYYFSFGYLLSVSEGMPSSVITLGSACQIICTDCLADRMKFCAEENTVKSLRLKITRKWQEPYLNL